VDDQRRLRSLEGQPTTNDGDERGRPALGQASGIRALPAGQLVFAHILVSELNVSRTTVVLHACCTKHGISIENREEFAVNIGGRMKRSWPKS